MSYQWRNNPKIWRHTCSKPDRHITVEMESESLARILTREDEKRFAICLSDNGAYIGNIFYTDIRDGEAQLHILSANKGSAERVERIVRYAKY